MKNKKGFTLVEIIVVLVVMAILAAIAVPAVLGYIDDANDAKYLGEGRAILNTANVEATKLKSDGPLQEDALTNIIDTILKEAELNGKIIEITNDEKSCTSFVYQIEDEQKYVIYTKSSSKMEVVDKYNNEEPPTNETPEETKDPLSKTETFNNILGALTNAGIDGKNIDSTDPDDAKYVKTLKDAGIDLEAMGAKAWRYFKDNDDDSRRLIWSTVDISNLDKIRYIPVMGYSFTNKNYSVWNCKLDHNPNKLGAIKGNDDNQLFIENGSYNTVYAEYTKQLNKWTEANQ